MQGFIKLHRHLRGDQDAYHYRDGEPPVEWIAVNRIVAFGTAYSNKEDPSKMTPDGGWVLLEGHDQEARPVTEIGASIWCIISDEALGRPDRPPRQTPRPTADPRMIG